MSTLDYYNENAKAYVQSTIGLSMENAIAEFIKALGKSSGTILDFGCGSGRDSRVFMDKGYSVVPADGSDSMCIEAERLLGIPVRHILFYELDDVLSYDGIWASASILHLPYNKLKTVIAKMERALKHGGVIYMSFRYGDMEGLRGDRYFTDMNEEKLGAIIEDTSLSLIKSWISEDMRLDRAGDRWFNILLRRD